MSGTHLDPLFQVFNSSQELTLTAKYPDIRTFMVAQKSSDIELSDLLQVELPWSVPTSGAQFVHSEDKQYVKLKF